MYLPAGYVSFRVGPAAVVCQPPAQAFAASALEQAGSVYEWAQGVASRSLAGGRAPAHVVSAPVGPCVVRHYVRGGAVATLLGDRYARLGTPRPMRELRVSVFARSHGISTPEVIAAVIYPLGPFYRADLVTRFVPDSATLADITFGHGRRDATARLLAWRSTGRAVRAAASAGVLHADLNLRNVLIAGRPDAPVPFLLDLDRCSVVSKATDADVARMVQRFHRSVRRIADQPAETEQRAFDEGVRA